MNSKNYNLYTISFIILILDCAFSYITKSLLSGYIAIICLLCFISSLLVYKERRSLSFYGIITYIILSYGFMYSFRFDFNKSIVAVVKFLPVITLFMISKENLLILKDKIVRFFSVLVFASLIIYIFKIAGVSLPIYEKTYLWQYEIVNYYYIYTDAVRYVSAFTGFCLEAGYFGFLCICLLALEKFDLRKRTSQIFTLAIVLSMSLEAYILFAIGILLYSISRGEDIAKITKYFIAAFIVLMLAVIIATNYNGGDNIVGEKIFERLEYDEELGIVGNNRESDNAAEIVDRYFYSNSVWLGIGHDKFDNLITNKGFDICSWRAFVIIYGAIYTIIVFGFSIFCLLKTNIKKTFPFFVIFWADFIVHASISSESLYILIIILLLSNRKEKEEISYY